MRFVGALIGDCEAETSEQIVRKERKRYARGRNMEPA